MFSERIVTNLSLVGRLKHLLEAWEKLTKDSEILEIVKIPFLKNPAQERLHQTPHMGLEQAANTSGEREHVEEESHTVKRASGWGVFKQYFLGREEMRGKRPVVNLR